MSEPSAVSVRAGSDRRARARVKKKWTAARARLAIRTMVRGRSQVMGVTASSRGNGV